MIWQMADEISGARFRNRATFYLLLRKQAWHVMRRKAWYGMRKQAWYVITYTLSQMHIPIPGISLALFTANENGLFIGRKTRAEGWILGGWK